MTRSGAGSTGRVVPGYEAKVIDDAGHEMPPGIPGRLAVRGPTGCRYLADTRQTVYVQSAWNVTGDTYAMDKDRYFWYQARSDDMIISAGYNIAGPEVETVLLTHPAVAECGVVASPCPERGHIVKAYVVLRAGQSGDDALTKALQDFVKEAIAPYKYPRAIEYVDIVAAHADRKAAALRAAQDRARRRQEAAGILRRSLLSESPSPRIASRVGGQHHPPAGRMAAAEGLRQRHQGARRNGLHRRHDRLGCERTIPGRARRADATGIAECRWRCSPQAAHGPSISSA